MLGLGYLGSSRGWGFGVLGYVRAYTVEGVGASQGLDWWVGLHGISP